MSSSKEELSRDAVFDLLSSARRRYVLYYLRSNEGEATINELAKHLAAWESDSELEELTRQDQKRVYVSLYQTHVPKLEEQGIVEYDGDSSIVSLTGRAYELDRFLSSSDDSAFPWQLYFLGLALVCGGFFALVAIDAPLFGEISTIVAGVAIVLAFAISAAVQYVRERTSADSLPAELGVDE
jgi:DNA-binding transcriptional ArsR family regulator